MNDDTSVFDLAHDFQLDSTETLHLAAFVEDKAERSRRDGFIHGADTAVLVASAVTALGLAAHRLLAPAVHVPSLPPKRKAERG